MRSIYFENMSLYCGLIVQKYVHKMWESQSSYTHNTQTIFSEVLIKDLYPFLFAANKQVLHTYFIQFVSVINSLYAVSTGPITTTTYINNKKGLLL